MLRVLTLVRSYNVTPEELFDLFGKYGPIRYVALIRVGSERLPR
jgi:RNA recognition motif-containing protein